MDPLDSLNYWSSNQFFMNLGQFTSDSDFTVANLALKLIQRVLDPMRSLEEHDGAAHGLDPIEPYFAVF